MELLDLINTVGRLACDDQKQVEIAKELGITQPTVATYARFHKLLTAQPALQEHVRRGTLGADQLRALTDLIYKKPRSRQSKVTVNIAEMHGKS